MASILKELPAEQHPDLLVGYNKSDDAGVFKLNDKQALVQTVDFFPPIVDDPYWFGQIAAANALSDIYAMGGKPLTALNIVGFPPHLPPGIMTAILRGGADKIHEAGAVIAGGHSIKDKEIKYGVSCTGIIDIDKIIRNDQAQIGDSLVLTKPLGTGIMTTAIKQNKATAEDISHVIAIMAALNKTASELMVKYAAHAATDITGFGLLGHSFEMADGSGVSLELDFYSLPLLKNVLKYAELGALTGGANANKEYLESKVHISSNLTKAQIDLLYDAQTSGGLLIALPENSAKLLLAEAGKVNQLAIIIGRVVEKQDRAIFVK